MSLASEFKEFAIKGNMIDMAVGIIVGAAFGRVVESLVKDVIMPAIEHMEAQMKITQRSIIVACMSATVLAACGGGGGTGGMAPMQATLFFFRAADPTSGAELWTSDGSESGTRLVKEVAR